MGSLWIGGGVEGDGEMNSTDKYPQRKHPVHMPPIERHNAPIIVLVTMNVKPRTAVLDNDKFHSAFRQAADDADAWSVGEYQIMPDHMHLFCRPAVEPRAGIAAWCTYLKKCISRHLGMHDWKWQPDVWDRQIRDQEHYRDRIQYVRMNPVRKALVDRPDDWQYRGRMNVLDW
jgi:putative transposase